MQKLFLGNSQDAGVAKMLESVLNQVLQAQVTIKWLPNVMNERMDAKAIATVSIRTNSQVRVGTLTWRVPRIRNGKFSTELFTRYQQSEQALVLALMEMVVNGVSTRKVSQITCVVLISPSLRFLSCVSSLIPLWKPGRSRIIKFAKIERRKAIGNSE